ncbi:hypothetical protein ACT7DJ_00005 [Bacillus cereus]
MIQQIKIVDITKLSTAMDKLFAIGGLTINDVIMMLGKERLLMKNGQTEDM